MNAPPPNLGRISEALMRDALLGAGTSVWEWHIQSDRLSNIDTSAALLGYGPGELLSLQETWNEVIHPDDRLPNHEAYLRHARGETPIYEHEYRARARDGQWRWIAERGRIVEWDEHGRPARMVGTLSDITLRRQAQGAALEMAERLSKVSRHVPGVVYQYRAFVDGSGQFPWVSDSCVDLFGLAPQAMVDDASRALRLIERDDRERVFASVRRAQRAMRTWHAEFRLHRRDASPRWVRATATPQPEAGGSVLWHGYVEDITELRELEQARQAATAAQAANRAKTEFLSRMSHELRTPLNAVLGFAQLLELDQREPLSDTQRRRVVLIREAGTHLLQMIGELLDLTRIEAGQLSVAPALLPLVPLLAESLEMVRPQADAAGVELQFAAPERSPTVRADPTRLRQVLLNLLGNAIKYNRRGGAVTLGVMPQGADVRIEVADTGMGIAADDLPGLFEPFNRGAHRHSTIEGTGIGLAVTRALVDLMGGRIDVFSTPGEGSTFGVELPIAADDQMPSRPT
ncbi:MAG: PAS domain-containing protein [Piscinibacter sp.]|nr:PAS domain-containing protein [Piscinibacter sp.]